MLSDSYRIMQQEISNFEEACQGMRILSQDMTSWDDARAWWVFLEEWADNNLLDEKGEIIEGVRQQYDELWKRHLSLISSPVQKILVSSDKWEEAAVRNLYSNLGSLPASIDSMLADEAMDDLLFLRVKSLIQKASSGILWLDPSDTEYPAQQ